jgi:GTP-binding protein Era
MNAAVESDYQLLQAQTTRHRILGIVNGEDFQMILSDTESLKPAYDAGIDDELREIGF